MATPAQRTKPATTAAPKPKRSPAERKARAREWLRRQDPDRLAVLYEALLAGRRPQGMSAEEAERLRALIDEHLSTDADFAFAEGARVGETVANDDLQQLREEAEAAAEEARREGYAEGYAEALERVEQLEVALESEEQLKEAIADAEARVAELEARKAELDARRKELQLEERELRAFEAKLERRAEKAAGKVTGTRDEAEGDDAEAAEADEADAT